jgi:hypothetical protein
MEIIMENLRTTRSVNITSNNILEGLLPIPENHIVFEEDAPQIARSNEATSSTNGIVPMYSEPSTSTSTSSPTSSRSSRISIGDSNTSISSGLSIDALEDESK